MADRRDADPDRRLLPFRNDPTGLCDDPKGPTMTALLEGVGLTRSFGQVKALDGVDFDVRAGEVVALIGDNGAGKSTLIKALSGNLSLDSGQIYFDGEPVTFSSPKKASSLGIETVFQDLALAPHLDSVQNMFLGREIMRKGLVGHFGLMDSKRMRRESHTVFEDLGATVKSLSTPVGTLSGGQRQAVAIARAVAWANRVIFLDEPTAALGVRQTRNVLETIRRVRDRGVGIVLISHSMPDVRAVADRIQVLRLGKRVETFANSETTVEELVGAMTGASVGSGA